ncbi:MAG: hypothetical protein ACLQAH_07495 [Limisphaerales bacterium]
MTSIIRTPDAATDNKLAAEITDKRGFGQRWLFSTRHVDNLIAAGLPHCKIGSRRIRILIGEADKWMVEKYGTQRRGAAQTTGKGSAQ